MSMILAKSNNIQCSTLNNILYVGDYDIDLDDFCQLVQYVLTNFDLQHNDPRLMLMSSLAKLNVVQGYNGPQSRRLG